MINNLEPVAKVKLFVGEMKIYSSMSEYEKQIEVTDVYTKEQFHEAIKQDTEELKDILKNLDKLSVYLSWCDDVDIDEKTKLDSQREKLKQVIERMEN